MFFSRNFPNQWSVSIQAGDMRYGSLRNSFGHVVSLLKQFEYAIFIVYTILSNQKNMKLCRHVASMHIYVGLQN